MNESKLWEIRRNKKKCDWGAWESWESYLACELRLDCKGCGAWKEHPTIVMPSEAETVIFQLRDGLYEVKVSELLKFLRKNKREES